MQLYLVRHGSTIMNEKGVYQGWTDAPLSETGKQQCEAVKAKLRQVSFDAVISSPLERSLNSAQIITGMDRERIITEAAFQEFNFGVWEGLNHKEARAQYPREWDAWCSDWQHARPPQGESFEEFYQRVAAALENLLRAYPGQTVLLVSHAGTLKCIVSRLLDMPPEAFWRFYFESGCYSQLELIRGTAVLKKING